MKKLKTKDGETILSDNGETYNPVTGALEHAFKRYVEACNIKSGIRVLDIGFGLGYNSGAVVHKILEENGEIEIIGLELNEGVLDEINNIGVPGYFEKAYWIIRKAAKKLVFDDNKIKIKIIIGDARKGVKKAEGKFDVIFLDGFSVMKNPELYSKEFFELLKEKLGKNGILACYSGSPIVRAGLREAGFNIGNGVFLGNVKTTLASLDRKLGLSQDDEKLIKAFGKPFYDPELNWTRERIIKEWGKLAIQNP